MAPFQLGGDEIMKATVVYPFYDLEDETKHVYTIGDIYPRSGQKVSEERVKELSTSNNKIGRPLIMLETSKEENKEENKEEKAPKKEKKEKKSDK